VERLHDLPEIQAALNREEGRALLSYSLNIAARSYGRKKLAALTNATVRGVFHHPDNVDLTVIVFAVLDRLTDGHITLLQTLRDHEIAGEDIPWPDLVKVGVQLAETPEGMSDPQPATRHGETKTYFVDHRHLFANHLLINDLVSLGLMFERAEPVGPIYTWSTEASENLKGTARVTAKGILTLEHIAVVRDEKPEDLKDGSKRPGGE
jgi:hypothetical protein